MQEMGTAVQYRLPVKQFILNNERLGMVRQWQELLHGERYSHSWSEALPDFVKLAEAFGCKGIKCDDPDDLDDAIREMLAYDGPVIFDCLVEKHENCFPMIPSGKAAQRDAPRRSPACRCWPPVACRTVGALPRP
jgi:acetolactate synthase-1/2/3 large subunit